MTNSSTQADAAPERPSTDSPGSDHRGRTLTRWALAMIPGTAVSALAAFFVGTALMHATGTPEGKLLTSAGFAGWVSWVVVTLLMVSAPLVGVVVAVLARREGGDNRSIVALYGNALLVFVLAFGAIGNLFS